MKDFVKKNIFSILTVLFAISLGISAYFIATHFIQERQQASEFEELAQIVEQCPENDCDKSYSEKLPILSDYAELYLQNEDMVGWISIPDTHINYPVMQTVDNPNYYLKKNFNHEYSDYGVPYIQENCNISTPSDNIIIYSHHMRNGTMFADLENYKSKDFFDNHRYH